MATPRHSSDELFSLPITTVYRTPAEFWAASARADWMLALLQDASNAGFEEHSRDEELRRFACWCARSVLHLTPADNCQKALHTAEAFLAHQATQEELETAWAQSHILGAPSPRSRQGILVGAAHGAAAFACTESANPDPLTAAVRTAYYTVLAHMWSRVKDSKAQEQEKQGLLFIHIPLWEHAKLSESGHPKPSHWDVWRALESDGQDVPDLEAAARHQVRSEVLSAQAECLRQLIPNPFGDVTWARLGMANETQRASQRDVLCKETTERDQSRARPSGWGRGWWVEPDDPLVYGEVEASLVFIPMKEAKRLSAIYAAVESARTWGEFRRMLPDGVYSEIIKTMIENDRGFDEFYVNWIEEHPDGTRAEACREYQKLPFHERLPEERDPFDSADIPGLCDGDWPDWPHQEMLNWVPTAIQQTYGQRGESRLNGPFLTFRPEDESAIVEAFSELGYQCRRDDRLVRRACGRTG